MATAVNDITGKPMKTGVVTDDFRSGHDLIWGKKEVEKKSEVVSQVVIEEKAQKTKQ